MAAIRSRGLWALCCLAGLILVALSASASGAAAPSTGGLIVVDAISDTGTQDIAVFNPISGDVHYLIHTWAWNEHEPRWSPDGTRIVYVVQPSSGGQHDVWIMNADGSGQTQLTNNDLNEEVPSFTADGRITFSRCVSGPRGCDVWIMNADGSGQRNLTDFDDWQGYTSSSPSGNKLAFHWCGGGVDWCQIFSMKSDGSGLAQLTHADTWVSQPDWSPNGNQIAYVNANNRGDIWVMKSNGDAARNLTNTPDLVENFPQWSPDGTKIVYTDNDGSDGSGHIWIVDVATGLRSMLFSFAPPRDYAFGYPDWQPASK